MMRIVSHQSSRVRALLPAFRARVLLAVVALLPAGQVQLGAAELLAGPLIGHTTPTSTCVWVETSGAAEVRVDYWEAPRLQYDDTLAAPVRRGSATTLTAAEAPHTGVIELRDLQPGWLVNYAVRLDGVRVRALSPQSVSLLPPETTTGGAAAPSEFVVAFGSCIFPARIPIQPIWAQIVRRRPAAFLFLGDNNYLPDTPEALALPDDDLREIFADTHRSLRNVAGLRELVASTPVYATWDDHDFGPNNSDCTFPARALGQELFRRYWPNPYATAANGVYHSFRVGDAEFFVLDNRSHRDPETAPDRRTMLGSAQRAWLQERLAASPATFKVIAGAGTLLANSGGETWGSYGAEREAFLAWLFREGITGVFFIAGDWHVGGLHRLHRPQDAYPLYELLSSNLAVRLISDRPPDDDEMPGNHQWAAPYYAGYNFGLLGFAGPAGHRTATLQVIDEAGGVRIRLQLSERDLRAAPAPAP